MTPSGKVGGWFRLCLICCSSVSLPSIAFLTAIICICCSPGFILAKKACSSSNIFCWRIESGQAARQVRVDTSIMTDDRSISDPFVIFKSFFSSSFSSSPGDCRGYHLCKFLWMVHPVGLNDVCKSKNKKWKRKNQSNTIDLVAAFSYPPCHS